MRKLPGTGPSRFGSTSSRADPLGPLSDDERLVRCRAGGRLDSLSIRLSVSTSSRVSDDSCPSREPSSARDVAATSAGGSVSPGPPRLGGPYPCGRSACQSWAVPDVASSPTLLIALLDLNTTDGKALLKIALRQLIANQVLEPDVYYAERVTGGPQRRPVLVNGAGTVPLERLLRAVANSVARTKPMFYNGERVVRDLARVAGVLYGRPGRKYAVELALDDLQDAELVHADRQVRLRVLRRTVYARTRAGQEMLTRMRIPPRPHGPPMIAHLPGHGYSDTGFAFFARSDQAGDTPPGRHSDFDAAFDRSFNAGWASAIQDRFGDLRLGCGRRRAYRGGGAPLCKRQVRSVD